MSKEEDLQKIRAEIELFAKDLEMLHKMDMEEVVYNLGRAIRFMGRPGSIKRQNWEAWVRNVEKLYVLLYPEGKQS